MNGKRFGCYATHLENHPHPHTCKKNMKNLLGATGNLAVCLWIREAEALTIQPSHVRWTNFVITATVKFGVRKFVHLHPHSKSIDLTKCWYEAHHHKIIKPDTPSRYKKKTAVDFDRSTCLSKIAFYERFFVCITIIFIWLVVIRETLHWFNSL